jgi:hypothetical protein
MELDEAETFLGTILHGIDSTLLDEWERMRNGEFAPPSAKAEAAPPKPRAITRDRAAFTRLVRGVVFDFLKRLWQGDEAGALELAPKAEEAEGSPAERIGSFRQARGSLRFDPEARNAKHFHVREDEAKRTWRVEQVLVDAEGLNDWSVSFLVDLGASDAEGRSVLRWESLAER